MFFQKGPFDCNDTVKNFDEFDANDRADEFEQIERFGDLTVLKCNHYCHVKTVMSQAAVGGRHLTILRRDLYVVELSNHG